ncbi:unnamed protein product, partial [Discosporangium mesarthrocarpum]
MESDGLSRRWLESASETHGDAASDEGRREHHLSNEEERRLLGAFLINAEEGVDGTGEGDQPHLPLDNHDCLMKFSALAASLGLKLSQEELLRD